ncbi:ricin-type beta-trefoil lectin domain protein [Kitasatospora sp. NPDC059827]|uniref:ricin-type beta-trefoil lectin domain protein n=1 Tax=Kitasatospora sp. NPDC059827 TaxID=3346964 RepID=UPI003656741B
MPPTPGPARTPVQQAMVDAVTKAKSTGKAVVVDTMTNEVSKTLANPDGTLTTTDNAQAVRTKQNGAWADLDPTLRPNSDGTLSPAVASTALAFSGGGSGPMATVSTSDGKRLSFGAPFTLPKPALDGATATYANVLPGVDLQLTVLPIGGWRDVIVVRTPEAAANPALKTLRFPITAQGLTVTSDPQGHIDVKDDKGTLRFRSPSPLQWDSSTTPAASARVSKSVKASFAAAPAAPAADSVPTAGVRSSAEEPGDGANVASITTKVTSAAVELTPNQDALGSGTGPWYLDPSLVATSSVQGSVEVQENHKTAENFNKKNNLATGFCGYHSSDPNLDCGSEGRQRAYFQFGINPALYTKPGGAESPPTIFTSTLNAQVTSASSAGTDTPFEVFSAPKPIHEHTSWNDQPCGTNGVIVMENCPAVNGQRLTGTGPLAIDVTDIMKQAIAGQWPWWTAAIAPQTNEWDQTFRHYIANNPYITTTYDIAPTVWWTRATPTPGFASDNSSAPCTTGGAHPWDNPGWIGSNQNIYLTANSYSPAGMSLYTSYRMWDDNDANFSFTDGRWGGSYNNPAESVTPGPLSDGHQYGWYAQSADGTLSSPGSGWCYFRVDRTNPRVSISSTDFPPSGTPNPNPAKYMNDWGRFTVNAEDPAPGPGLRASGVACVRVSTDPTPVVGWKCGQNDTLAPGQPYDYQAKQWGTNTLYAWAMDNAGNYSQPAIYNFYVPWKPGTQPLFGDVTNDQKPDIVLADKNGDLRIIGGGADPSTSLAAPAAAAPGSREFGTTWADFQISHHGTFAVGQPVDQLVAHYNKDKTPQLKDVMYLIPNDGTGRFGTLTPSALNRPTTCTTYGTGKPCPAYTQKVWSNVSQVVAIGTPEGEAIGGEPGHPDHKVMMTQTSLLTVENNSLYLFQPNGLAEGLDTATLIPTASGNWSDFEILTPGAANGATTMPGATDPTYQTTVWARHRTNGNIYAYPLSWKADGTVDYSALTKPDAGTPILTGANWTVTAQPLVGAADLNNDGYPDLWAINTSNAITVFPGKSSTGTKNKVDGFDSWKFLGYSDASTSLHPNLASSQCMDAWGGPRDGAPLAIGSCWNTVNQRFNLSTDGTIRAGSYCVSTVGNANTNGTQLSLATCDGRPTQQWNVRPDGRIINQTTITGGDPNTGRCIELNNWHTEQGTRLDIWDCPGLFDNSRWTLQPERTP